jgi:hypothetical protein
MRYRRLIRLVAELQLVEIANALVIRYLNARVFKGLIFRPFDERIGLLATVEGQVRGLASNTIAE